MLAKSLPYWPINPSLSRARGIISNSTWRAALWALLPATLLWGASFPLALAAAARGQRFRRGWSAEFTRPTPWAESSAASASARFHPVYRHATKPAAADWPVGVGRAAGVRAAVMCKRRKTVLAAGALRGTWHWPRWCLIPVSLAHGRRESSRRTDRLRPLHGDSDGRDGSALRRRRHELIPWPCRGSMRGRHRNFHVSGKVEASSEPQDMRLQRMLGHLPALVHPDPRSVLVVGCGAGVTAGSFTVYPGIDKHHHLRNGAARAAALPPNISPRKITAW